ncbi:MAG: hypothetical protein KJ066_16295 [Acidobacteria bacterium]|nr:hypothetical protein [Acidobacteriota bacterium]
MTRAAARASAPDPHPDDDSTTPRTRIRAGALSTARLYRAVAEHLAIDEAALRERVHALEADLAALLEVLRGALDALHELEGRERARKRRVERLLDEIARLKATRPRAAA